MNTTESNKSLLLMKTGRYVVVLYTNNSSLKSLVNFTESLVEENEKLRKELITAQSAKNDEMNDLSNK